MGRRSGPQAMSSGCPRARAAHNAAMLYLASQSPQRAALLNQAGITFTVVSSAGDERLARACDPGALAIERAVIKARGAQGDWHAGDLVLGADTVVAFGDEEFGKPRDETDARRMLHQLSRNPHVVHTGHCLRRFYPDGVDERTALASTAVTMRPLSDAEIEAYIATGEWRDRAGSYAIQESGDAFVTGLDGDFDTVVGLSIAAVRKLLEGEQARPVGG